MPRFLSLLLPISFLAREPSSFLSLRYMQVLSAMATSQGSCMTLVECSPLSDFTLDGLGGIENSRQSWTEPYFVSKHQIFVLVEVG